MLTTVANSDKRVNAETLYFFGIIVLVKEISGDTTYILWEPFSAKRTKYQFVEQITIY